MKARHTTWSLAVSRLILALSAGALAGCTLGPVWASHIDGRVIDGLSGEPVAGARVTTEYHFVLIGGHGSGYPLGRRSTTTDADGRFAFRGRPLLTFVPGAVTSDRPDLAVSHPAYEDTGTILSYEEKCCRGIELELRHAYDDQLDRRVDAKDTHWLCEYVNDEDECEERVRAVYPDAPETRSRSR